MIFNNTTIPNAKTITAADGWIPLSDPSFSVKTEDGFMIMQLTDNPKEGAKAETVIGQYPKLCLLMKDQ